jgi:hypothetical protein
MKCLATHLFAELRSLVQGWWALRAIEFGKYRLPSRRSEPRIEARLLRGDGGVAAVDFCSTAADGGDDTGGE